MFGQDTSATGFGSAAQIDDSTQSMPHSSYIDEVTQPAPAQPWSPAATTPEPATEQQAPAAPVGEPHPAEPAQSPAQVSSALTDADDLLAIKQQALGDLAPLVSQLNQTPEEKFKTTMMMIQASDDHSLVKGAYEAARMITDEETRAHALLDIVNEINYFTAQSDQA